MKKSGTFRDIFLDLLQWHEDNNRGVLCEHLIVLFWPRLSVTKGQMKFDDSFMSHVCIVK